MEDYNERRENFYKTLRVGKAPPGEEKYEDAHSRLYAKLPAVWCRRIGLGKGDWIKVIDEGERLIIELPGGARE